MSLHEWWVSDKHAKRPLLFVTILAVVQGAALILSLWPEPAPWDPIEPYERQTVRTVDPIGYDQSVTVEGRKCYRDDVTVSGVVSWATEGPSGTHIETGRGQAERFAGCVEFSGQTAFQNTIPDAVIEADQALKAQGIDARWYITGTETPMNDDGERGVARTWRTDSFRLHDGAES